MELFYLVGIFEDSYNIVRDRFKTDSIKFDEKQAACCKETQSKFKYILTWFSHIRKSYDIRNSHQDQKHSKPFRKPYWRMKNS